MYLEAIKYILCYFKSIVDLNLVLGWYGEDNFDLVDQTDLNQAQNLDNQRFVGGFIFGIADSFISWSFKKQPTMATSFVKAKYIISANTIKKAVQLQTLLKSLTSLKLQL